MGRLLFTLIILAVVAGACSKSDDAAAPSSTLSAEAQMIAKATAALKTANTSQNGLLNGTGYSSFVSSSHVEPKATLDPETDCTNSGSAATGGTNYALRTIYCSMMRSPDGPDSVRGGLDRVSGFLCALGTITYDGVAQTKSMVIDTNCFSQTFVTMVESQLNCSASAGTCKADIIVTGHSSASGVGPTTGYDKYFTMLNTDLDLSFTVLIKDSGDEKAAAILYGQPTDTSAHDAFAVYMNKGTGVLRYEGRFYSTRTGNLFRRHIRANLVGTMDSTFNYTDVQTMEFVQGESSGDNNAAWYISMKGTPAAGRMLLYKSTSDITVATPTWTNQSEDGTCFGEAGAACTGNTGITQTGKPFFFQGTFTGAHTWFTSNSDIGAQGTIDMADLWD